jgi:hypothetical protein
VIARRNSSGAVASVSSSTGSVAGFPGAFGLALSLVLALPDMRCSPPDYLLHRGVCRALTGAQNPRARP